MSNVNGEGYSIVVKHSTCQRVRIIVLKKTLRKGLYFAYVYVLDIGEKGPFFFF